LQYRPKNYVPIKVAVSNASAHDWRYRPEMQFSVFDLKIKEVQVESDAIDSTQNIYPKTSPIIDSDASMLTLFFDLLEGKNAPLE
jgi:hypothetical protein